MKAGLASSVVVIAVVYIIIGGLVFRAIEETNDIEQRSEIQSTLRTFFNQSDDGQLRLDEVKKILPVIRKSYEYGVDVNEVIAGSNSSSSTSTSSNWDLYSSTFFAVTVVTTIGYGNAPLKTDFGRIFCIFYALAGVPLCMLALVVVGQQEKRFIYFVARKMAFGFRENERRMHLFTTLLVSVGGSVVFVYLSAVVFMKCEEWNYGEAIYFCLITLLTIGFGDYAAGWSKSTNGVWYRILIAVWILFGLSWCSIVISVCQDLYNDLIEKTSKMAGAVGSIIESSVKSKVESISKHSADSSMYSEKKESSLRATSAHDNTKPTKTSSLTDIEE